MPTFCSPPRTYDMTPTRDQSMHLADLLDGSPYQSYAYSYPHKTTYRPLDPPRPLEELWRDEDQRALFLYVHIPFCEMRCGFCNLFTIEKPKDDLRTRYLDALERQAAQVRGALADDAGFARYAVGGGTPTQLEPGQLARLFELLEEFIGHDTARIPGSMEASPETITAEKLAVLEAHGVERVSIGVQSFVEQETRAARRPVGTETARRALELISASDVPTLNLDLIYGLPEQTDESWRYSLAEALSFHPEEIYLYPLYVRPLTGLGNSSRSWDDHRLALYRQGRDFLLESGYEQVSMRMFRRVDAPSTDGPVYCCQEDGMVGLGAGARSYTRGLHYSSEYAVGRRGRLAIIEDFVARDDADFARADYGVELDDEEQKRRFVILSVLSREGLDPAMYRRNFGSEVDQDFPEFDQLRDADLLAPDQDALRLNARGVERSDVIGPWLFSQKMRQLAEEYELR